MTKRNPSDVEERSLTKAELDFISFLVEQAVKACN
jgi:hypothetical protein